MRQYKILLSIAFTCIWMYSYGQVNLFRSTTDADPRTGAVADQFRIDTRSLQYYDIYRSNPMVSKIVLVEVNQEALSSGSLFINYGPQQSLANQSLLERRTETDYSWFGTMDDGTGIFFTVMEGNVASKFYLGNIPCTLLPLKGDVHMLVMYGAASKAMATCLNRAGKLSIPATNGNNEPLLALAPPLPNDNTCNVRLLIAVTATAESELTMSLDQVAQMLADETNLAYQQSLINFRVEIARVMRTTYNEVNTLQPSGQSDDIINFRNGNAPLNAVHTMRDVYQSDVQILLRRGSFFTPFGQTFGEAFEIATGAANPDPANAFCLVVTDFIIGGRFTFAHEIGHLQGARHDNHNSTPTYARGFILNGAGSSIRTIMSTANVVSCGTVNNGCRVQFFSNPNVIFNGNAMGAADRDNARRLNETSNAVKSHRRTSENLTVQNETFDNEILANHLANSTITTSGTVSASSGSRVSMRATDHIILTPGFQALAGSRFIATVSNLPCTTAPPQPRSELVDMQRQQPLGSSKDIVVGNEKIRSFPNPSDEVLYFTFSLQKAGPVSLYITDITGRSVYTVARNAFYEKGEHRLKYNSNAIPQGMYTYTFMTNDVRTTGKVIIVH